jgi:hypothetical protein
MMAIISAKVIINYNLAKSFHGFNEILTNFVVQLANGMFNM